MRKLTLSCIQTPRFPFVIFMGWFSTFWDLNRLRSWTSSPDDIWQESFRRCSSPLTDHLRGSLCLFNLRWCWIVAPKMPGFALTSPLDDRSLIPIDSVSRNLLRVSAKTSSWLGWKGESCLSTIKFECVTKLLPTVSLIGPDNNQPSLLSTAIGPSSHLFVVPVTKFQ